MNLARKLFKLVNVSGYAVKPANTWVELSGCLYLGYFHPEHRMSSWTYYKVSGDVYGAWFSDDWNRVPRSHPWSLVL